MLFVRKQRGSWINILFCILLVLLCLPALRETGIDRDTYVMYYDSGINFVGVEPSYRWLSYFVKTCFDDVLWLFLICAILGIGLKLLAIRLYSPFIWVSLFFYLSSYYVLHDMIQIRAGIASGFLLLLTKCYYEKTKKDILYILGTTALATSFHYTGLLLLLPLFLNSKKINKNFYYILLITSIFMLFMNSPFLFNIIVPILPQEIHDKLIIYYSYNETVGIFGFRRLFELFFIFALIHISERIYLKYKYFIILLKIYILAIVFLFYCSSLPTVAIRLYELLAVVRILLFPSILFCRNAYIGGFLLLCFSLQYIEYLIDFMTIC